MLALGARGREEDRGEVVNIDSEVVGEQEGEGTTRQVEILKRR